MSDDNDNQGNDLPPGGAGGPEEEKNSTLVTLEQALLAPLDSILKAQLHSARSFLNLLLQLGYPHQKKDEGNDGHPYSMEFKFTQDGQQHTISVPALSLVPISPLAVDSATFSLEMSARNVIQKTQIRDSEKGKARDNFDGEQFDDTRRPWFLVDKPVDIMGDIVATSSGEAARHRESESAIKININVKAIPIPSGLDKLLASLTSMTTISTENIPPALQEPEVDDQDNPQEQ
jgi:Protein of unknown function (DUF2589)